MTKTKSKTLDEMRKMTNTELMGLTDAEILSALINVVIPRVRADIDLLMSIIEAVDKQRAAKAA